MTLEESGATKQENLMLKPKIEKVVINVSVGKSGEPLDRAMKIIQELTGQKPAMRKAKKTLRDFGIRKKEPMACLVTLRKARANEFLKKAFQAVDNKVSRSSFDECGNFSFGIKEHIDIPGTKYSPELGITGMNISVAVSRPGLRVKKRHWAKSDIGPSHLLTREETIQFINNELGIEIVEEQLK